MALRFRLQRPYIRWAVGLALLVSVFIVYTQFYAWLNELSVTITAKISVPHWGPITHDTFGFPLKTSDPPQDHAATVQPGSARHFYRDDGLLEVNPDGPHPIFELVKKAEENWKRKNDRASRTLKEACLEYERRHNRKPPRGFDVWWTYVQVYNVPLPDEYDLISRNMAPFWGIHPRRLQQNQRDREGYADSFTLGKDTDRSRMRLLNYALNDMSRKGHFTSGARTVSKLLEEVDEFIPAFRAVFNPHDNPNLLSDYGLLQAAIQAGKEGRYLDLDDVPPGNEEGNWLASCHPESPARTQSIDLSDGDPSLTKLLKLKHNSPYASGHRRNYPKTFIHDHKLSMNPCLHPSHLLTHGQFIHSNMDGSTTDRLLIPQFSYSPTALHHDIALAMPYNWVRDVLPRVDDPPFEEKKDSRLEWRGSTTGLYFGPPGPWWLSQRTRLVAWANPWAKLPFIADSILQSPPDEQWRVGEAVALNDSTVKWAQPRMTDVAFAGRPLDCAPETCRRLTREYEFRLKHDFKTQGKYKYIIDVDGNAWSSRFKRLITSNSLIFKSTIYEEWFADRVEPWLHYVPIQVDYSDLLDTLYFFQGDPSGFGGHPALAKKIAEAGRQWSLTHWRKVDLTAYMFRLFLEYARVMSVERDRGGMDYIYDEKDEYDPRDAEGVGSRIGSQSKFLQVMDRRRQRGVL
ncbi:Cap3p [Coprinopsis cinerea okayama7|uniref:Cap3p n=1 Tax=Coprinopsis cinerea (strain Okayama-7 / 130 / ATCC MYA-4618 / FGSC 9003) TaxID=240176 RepID=A8NTT1_COPC7|nr:Cap3p [Coprinopsis cinerea okayama7\|eukprot:XP_001836296.2 Cap3p [Coprinopsis cinerea okayama7\